MVLANCISTFLINGKPTFTINGIRSLSRIFSDCTELERWVFIILY